MSGWLSTSSGRALRMIIGLAVLFVGTWQVSVAGLFAMLAGLVLTVTAAPTGTLTSPRRLRVR